MEIVKLQPEDKVELVVQGCIGWEKKGYADQLKFNKTYTIDMVGIGGEHVTLKEVTLDPDPLEFHPNHFKKI